MRELFLDAFSDKKNIASPLWIMRQAGRYLPEYRKVRSNFENFMDMCRNADACCEVALQPLRRYDLDAAIVFSDILTIPEAMGMDLSFIKGKGPIFSNPIRGSKDIDNLLNNDNVIDDLNYVYNAVKITKSAVNVPLIGFTGSPWTLAAYMIEGQGSKQFNFLRKFMYSQPDLMHKLLMKVSNIIIDYLSMQVQNGADSLMIFDTWGGILPKDKYAEFSLKYMEYISLAVKNKHKDIPIVFFTKGGSNFLDLYKGLSCNGVGVDWNVSIDEARNRLGDNIVIQGNFDPAMLYASHNEIKQTIKKTMNYINADKNNYIVNLGHGVYPDVDPEKVKTLVESVRESFF